MGSLCKKNIWRWTKRKDNQIVSSRETNKALPRRKISGKERVGIQQPLYISARI
jgi:hypothetical protein